MLERKTLWRRHLHGFRPRTAFAGDPPPPAARNLALAGNDLAGVARGSALIGLGHSAGVWGAFHSVLDRFPGVWPGRTVKRESLPVEWEKDLAAMKRALKDNRIDSYTPRGP